MPCCGRGAKTTSNAKRRVINNRNRRTRSASVRQQEAGGVIEPVEPPKVEAPKAIEAEDTKAE